MTDTIEIPAGRPQAVLVLSLDLEGPEAKTFVRRPSGNGGGWPLKVALDADSLDAEHVEHLQVKDLAGIGLFGYLSEGLGLDETALLAERDRIDAATGDVLVLYPAAFGGDAQTLEIRPPLSLIGYFPETRARTTMERLHTQAAEGQVGGGITPGPQPTPKTLRLMAAAAAAVVVVGVLIALAGGVR